jgi:hypothetical protein
VIYLFGTATFVSLPKLASALETVPHDRELHIEFDHLNYIDHACLELLTSWAEQYRATGGSLTIDWKPLEARFRQPSLVPAPAVSQSERPASAVGQPFPEDVHRKPANAVHSHRPPPGFP